jgi:hypothetical protein
LYEQEDHAQESKEASERWGEKRKGKTLKTLTECFPIDKLRSITKQLAAKKTKPNGRKKNTTTTVCTKFWGPRKRVKKKKKKKRTRTVACSSQRKKEKNKSDSLAQHSETGSKPSTV